jgi:hypothetical protein
VDVRDPCQTKEVGYYVPATTGKAGKRCRGVIQTNNVEVDERGYIYIVDRARMHILELTGPAQAIAAFTAISASSIALAPGCTFWCSSDRRG